MTTGGLQYAGFPGSDGVARPSGPGAWSPTASSEALWEQTPLQQLQVSSWSKITYKSIERADAIGTDTTATAVAVATAATAVAFVARPLTPRPTPAVSQARWWS